MFNDEDYHLGMVLLNAWRNIVYCAMEAYKELFRHKRNEEKRHEMITCFQQIWTKANIFGRMSNSGIKWHVTPHQEFLTRDLAAWTTPPLRIIRTSQSPDPAADFTTRPDFQNLVQAFVQDVANNLPPQPPSQTTDTPPIPESQSVENTQDEVFQDFISPLSPPLSTNPTNFSTAHPRNQGHPADTLTQIPPTTQSTKEFTGESSAYAAELTAPRPLEELQINNFTRIHNQTAPTRPLQPPPQETQRPKSRPKAKCGFGPQRRRQRRKENEDPGTPTSLDHSSDDLEALLKEIDRLRHGPTQTSDPITLQATDLDPPRQPTTNERTQVNCLTNLWNRAPKSRPKIKCRFGPASGPRRDCSDAGTSNDEAARPLHVPRRSTEEDPPPRRDPNASPLAANRSANTEPAAHCTDHHRAPADRVTFFSPNPLLRTADDPNPSRFALNRLGITAEILDARVSEEIETSLLESLRERRLNRLFPPESLASSVPRILTKEDCMQLFSTTGVPTGSSLMGVYRWAANLGEARYNFDTDFFPESIALLDAYD